MKLLIKLNHLFTKNGVSYIIDETSNYYAIHHFLSKGIDNREHWLRCYAPEYIEYPRPDLIIEGSSFINKCEIVIDLGSREEVATLNRHVIKTNDEMKIKKIDDLCQTHYPNKIQVTERRLVKNIYGGLKFFTLDINKQISEQDMTLIYLMAGAIL